ncbi:MAG: efflux RND transporter periplasmic adaptor subunit [Lachnospiraceae bacterium]|nr:efflux RND transporter periplasmic adaptor subunit [Lachnospiraceae bacterium]
MDNKEIMNEDQRKAESSEQERMFRKRKDWIKNAIIIFLAVMLVLTFFSDTIKNYSLPQVVTQYVMSGSITTKVRGEGNVESGDPYNVMVKQSRVVAGIPVKVGQTVTAGDVLVYLDDKESTELKDAQKALEAAENAYDKALMDAEISDGAIADSKGNLSATSFRAQITALKKAVDAAETDLKNAKKNAAAIQNQIDLLGTVYVDTTAEQEAVNNAKKVKDAADEQLSRTTNELKDLEARLEYFTTVSSNDEKVAELEQLIREAKLLLIDHTKIADQAADAYTKALNALEEKKASLDTSAQAASLAAQLASANIAVSNAQTVYDEKKEKLDELVAQINSRYNLGGLYDAIVDAKKTLDEQEKDAMGAEITSPINGTVTAVNVQSGKETDPSVAVVVLQPEGQGYYMSFSVPNDKAKLVTVGDPAELVNNWWYNDMVASVSSIKPDPDQPGKNKLIVCEVKGSDITVGQRLTVSIGSRTSSYDLIVPTSAIHSDNNGKFILTIESKSTPLGNRYIAKRTDVEILASDDTQSAISAGLSGWGNDYVITGSTKDIEAGDEVRLSENN